MGQLGDTIGDLEAVTDPIFLPSLRYLILINLSWQQQNKKGRSSTLATRLQDPSRVVSTFVRLQNACPASSKSYLT